MLCSHSDYIDNNKDSIVTQKQECTGNSGALAMNNYTAFSSGQSVTHTHNSYPHTLLHTPLDTLYTPCTHAHNCYAHTHPLNTTRTHTSIHSSTVMEEQKLEQGNHGNRKHHSTSTFPSPKPTHTPTGLTQRKHTHGRF